MLSARNRNEMTLLRLGGERHYKKFTAIGAERLNKFARDG